MFDASQMRSQMISNCSKLKLVLNRHRRTMSDYVDNHAILWELDFMDTMHELRREKHAKFRCEIHSPIHQCVSISNMISFMYVILLINHATKKSIDEERDVAMNLNSRLAKFQSQYNSHGQNCSKINLSQLLNHGAHVLL